MTTSAEQTGGVALRRCVACSAQQFADRYWGREPLLTRAADLPSAATGFADLLSTAAVDELVSRRGLRTPFLRMAKDGSVLDRARFTRGGGAGASINDQVADDRVLALIGDGATLVLQALHRTWPPLVDFGTALADELGHPVQINAYITPPQNQGFAPHYDVHDVFVMQVSGRKQWTIHEPVVTDPLENQPWEQHRRAVAEQAAGAPLIDTVLEPGDVLYLPRGTIHAAKALGETSVHLTVGMHPVTRYHLLRQLLEAAQDDPALRASLPMGADLADPSVLAPHVAATIDALHARLERADVTAVADRVGDGLMRQTRPEPLAPLAQLAAADALTPDTPLRLRRGARGRLQQRGRQTVLRVLDRDVALTADEAAALKVVLAGAAFAPAELPGLDPAAQLAFARRLLREGVVVPA